MAEKKHLGPNPGILAIVYTLLFNAGLYFVISFRAPEHLAASQTSVPPDFPGPWESGQTIAAYFQSHPTAVLMCAFFQFGAVIPLGLFAATMVSRLQFLGVRAAGVHIALFGGWMAAFNIATSALVLWVMAYPGIAQEAGVLRALYYVVFAIGGVGFSVPVALLIAGISVPSLIMNLLPKWLAVSGLVLAVIGEVSAFSLPIPKLLFLIPLTRFPSFIWLILAGFKLPRGLGSARSGIHEELRDRILKLPGVTEKPNAGIHEDAFFVGQTMFMHIHGSGHCDIRLAKIDQARVLAQGKARPHRWAPAAGYVVFKVHNENDLDSAMELIRMSYDYFARDRSTAGIS
jgi:hypothetical protein